MTLGFLLAVMMDQKIRLEGVFRTIYLYPFALSFIVTGHVWAWIMSPEYGLQAAEALIFATAHRVHAQATVLRPTLVYGAGRDRTLTQIAALARRTRFFVLLAGHFTETRE